MLGFDESQWWAVGYGLVFGLMLIAGGIAVAVLFVDWKAIKTLREQRNAEPRSE
jgi:hypothetical protein